MRRGPLLKLATKNVVKLHTKSQLKKTQQTQNPTSKKHNKPSAPRVGPDTPALHPTPGPSLKTQLHRVRRRKGK